MFESLLVPHAYDLVPHVFSEESNELETHTYVRAK